jgi:hypothetical protein
VKKLLLILVMFLGMNNYGMDYGIKTIGVRVVDMCCNLGRDVMQGQYNKRMLGLIPATYLGLEMTGFFHMNKGKGAYDPEGFWKKRARILLGTGLVIGSSIMAAHKIHSAGEYDKNLLYSVAGIFAGLGCFRQGAYKNMIPSFLRTKKLKEELQNEFIVGGFIENDNQIHFALKKYAPTTDQVVQRHNEFKNNKIVQNLDGFTLIPVYEQAEKDANEIFGLVRDKYHSYMRNRTTLWGLAYAYLFKIQRDNPYSEYLNDFSSLMRAEKEAIEKLENPENIFKSVAPDNFVKYIMPLKINNQYSEHFWRINKYLGKRRTFWTNFWRDISPQPLTKFTEDGILLIDNECITSDREKFYARLITYGFNVQLKTPVMRFDLESTHYFDQDGKLKGTEDSEDVAEES